MTYLEILFWRIAKWLLYRGYGYCGKDEDECIACRASMAQDFIDEHIILLKDPYD